MLGPFVNRLYLRKIASSVTSFIPTKFESLVDDSNIVFQITTRACKDYSPPVTVPPLKGTSCGSPSVCFSIDQTRTVVPQYDSVREFMGTTAMFISDISAEATFSAYGFAGTSNEIQGPTTDLTGTFIPSLQKEPESAGLTNTFSRLNDCKIAVEGAKGRKAIVLLSDGRDYGHPRALTLVPELEAAGIKVVVVAITKRAPLSCLRHIGSDGAFTKIKKFSQLTNKKRLVKELACDL